MLLQLWDMSLSYVQNTFLVNSNGPGELVQLLWRFIMDTLEGVALIRGAGEAYLRSSASSIIYRSGTISSYVLYFNIQFMLCYAECYDMFELCDMEILCVLHPLRIICFWRNNYIASRDVICLEIILFYYTMLLCLFI